MTAPVQNVLNLLNKGEIFAAYDQGQNLLKTQLSVLEEIQVRCCIARVLLYTGAYKQVHQNMEPLIERNFAKLKDLLSYSEQNLQDMLKQTDLDFSNYDPADLNEIGKIYKEIFYYEWDLNPKQSLEYLRRSISFLLASYKIDSCPIIAVEAACLSWVLGDQSLWKVLIESVFQQAIPSENLQSGEELFTFYQALGCAFLLQHDMLQAKDAFTKACAAAKNSFSLIVNLRRQLRMLHRTGLPVTNDIFDILKPPMVVIFTGHPFDRYGQSPTLFPSFLEKIVQNALTQKIKELNIDIGYSSASCGADIIFAETIIAQGGEFNLVLPFNSADFIDQHIRLGGPAWQRRFENVLAKASSVIYATEENFLNHSILYRFGNKILQGAAEIRCQHLETTPHLLALWDHQNDSLPGGAGDFINQWGNIQTLHLIDLEELLRPYKEQPHHLLGSYSKNHILFPQDTDSNREAARVIKCMLFSDFSGFSKLSDKYIPHFIEFMQTLADHLKQFPYQPESLNTWGDAFFIIMDSPYQLAQYALQLNMLVKKFGQESFPVPLQARISLDVGPVFQINDPFSGKSNFFGGHINRAARLEPVTVVGQVFATQQFVSLLQAEQSVLKIENPEIYKHNPIECRYIGVIPLAKDWGMQAVYKVEGNILLPK